MGYNAKGKATIGASVAQPLADYLRARGERLEKSQSWAVARVISFWLRAGAPPLSELDRKLDPLPIPQAVLTEEGLPLAAEAPGGYNQPTSAADAIQQKMDELGRKAQQQAEPGKRATRSVRK